MMDTDCLSQISGSPWNAKGKPAGPRSLLRRRAVSSPARGGAARLKLLNLATVKGEIQLRC